MTNTKLSFLLPTLLCYTVAWATDYNVGTAPEGTVVTLAGAFSPLFIKQENRS